MTQVNSAQERHQKLALRSRGDVRTLAQRRAHFEAQMRDMALSDLAAVSARLKALRKEWELLDGRKWTDLEMAQAMKIAPRSFQHWQNGKGENRSGTGYDKMAAWYSRKLGRKITRHWILWGDGQPQPGPTTEKPKLQEAAGLNEVLAELAAVRVALKEQRSLIETVLRNQEAGN